MPPPGSESSVSSGWTSSTPPGACGLAATSPDTSTTVSSPMPSGGSEKTTWASPERSRTTTKVTDFRCRWRCTQPAIRTRWPTCAGSCAARIREIITLLWGYARPLGSAGEKGTRGATALSPPPARTPVTASSWPDHGGRPAGHRVALRPPFLPALRSVFATGREAAFSAAGGSLRLARSVATCLRQRVAQDHKVFVARALVNLSRAGPAGVGGPR